MSEFPLLNLQYVFKIGKIRNDEFEDFIKQVLLIDMLEFGLVQNEYTTYVF